MKTLVVFAHQYYENSKLNKRWIEAIENDPNVEIRNLDELYGSDIKAIDTKKEQEFLSKAKNIVFQFPLFWYSTPPMLKAYQDFVLTRGFAYGSQGNALKDKNFYMAVTTGSPESAYDVKPQIYLNNIVATAKMCNMNYKGIFIRYGVFQADDETLDKFSKEYAEFISKL
ncbi:MAG: NAD(P)H-dependent oxidoreductase [Campylobacter sp.]|nr:NAD(P)H-dependent oxidoreductase [Campylobacter sp.]